MKKKRQGKIELFLGMYFLIFLLILLEVQYQLKIFGIISSFAEDALAASNLASAITDVEEYGMTHAVRVEEPDLSFDIYCEALKENLNLNDAWECRQKDLIHGTVDVLKYEIYQVEGRDVTVYSYGSENKGVRRIPDGFGKVCTPDGTVVESATVYSKIGFPVKGIFGMEIRAEKEKTVDIVGGEKRQEDS